MSRTILCRPSSPPILPTRPIAEVTAHPGYYLVALPALFGWEHHLVRTDRTCACSLGAQCRAGDAVANYLRHGGQRAAPPRSGSVIPAHCPICGGATRFEPRLCSPMRGAGWVCLTAAQTADRSLSPRYWFAGESHFWQCKWQELGRLRFGSRS